MVYRYDQISLRKTTIKPSTSQRQRAKRKPRVLFSQVIMLLVNIFNGLGRATVMFTSTARLSVQKKKK